MKMEVNIIYDLLLKFLLLKTITLCKLLVLSFPEGSVVTISGLQAELKEQTERIFVFPKQMPFKAAVSAQHCWLTSSRDGHLDIRASAGQPLGYWTALNPVGPWCSDPCHGNQPSASYTSYFNPPLERTPSEFRHNLRSSLTSWSALPGDSAAAAAQDGAELCTQVGTGAAPEPCPGLCLSCVQTFSPISK